MATVIRPNSNTEIIVERKIDVRIGYFFEVSIDGPTENNDKDRIKFVLNERDAKALRFLLK